MVYNAKQRINAVINNDNLSVETIRNGHQWVVRLEKAELEAAGKEGRKPQIKVLENGTLTNIRILSGPPELHETVRTALRTRRYRPASVDGHAVATYLIVPFNFQLTNM